MTWNSPLSKAILASNPEAVRRRERRLEAKDASMGMKSKTRRDRDRDVSEKVALGMVGRGEVMYDQRLFNGMDSGFAADDQYNLYDKGEQKREDAATLFTQAIQLG
ncbi:hypothetical protein V2J09_016154 [Rumex salicifolius]